MIRKININPPSFIEAYLPKAKRTTNRLKFLKVVYSVFDTLSSEFVAFRNEAQTQAYVTGETMSMEWAVDDYLNNQAGAGYGNIHILTAGLSGVSAGIETVGTEILTFIAAGIEASEPTYFKAIGLEGETVDFGTKTFIVEVPTAYSSYENDIIAIINRYRAAGKSFKIVYY